AVPRGDGDCDIRHLAVSAFAAHLDHGFRHRGDVAQVVRGQQAAAGVELDLAVRTDHAGRLDHRATFANPAIAIAFDLHQHLGGEAIVELGHVDVGQGDSRLAEG